VDREPWTVDCGAWGVDRLAWGVDCGAWGVSRESWTVGREPWGVDREPWGVRRLRVVRASTCRWRKLKIGVRTEINGSRVAKKLHLQVAK